MVVILTIIILTTCIPGHARTTPNARAVAAIRTVLDRQVEAWNLGDLEGFMAGYWASDDLTFYSGGTITRGWKPTLEHYKKRYQGSGREMGKLNFEELDIQPISSDAAVVGGRWHLQLSGGKQMRGLFTLIMRKFPEGWRIVHDHSSAE